MKRRIDITSVSVWILLAGLLFAPSRIVSAQESPFVSAVLQDVGENLDRLNQVIEEHEALIKNYRGDDFAPTILFQLAELYERRAVLVFQREMEIYEDELDRFDKGEIQQEPVAPRINLSKAIETCQKLIGDYPDIDFIDKVFYKLAMAYIQEGNYARAKTFFEQIILKYPESQINLESHFRIGEYYFDRREFKSAIDHYKALLGKWDNPYFNMALYKLGWSYYIINDYPNAISTFLYLLEDIALLDRSEIDQLGKTKADLRTEAIQYMASCFTEFGDPEEARTFFEPLKEKDYSLATLLHIAQLYQKRNYYPEAIQTYRIILDIYPFYEEAPAIYDQIVVNYELDDKIDEANRARQELVTRFGPGGPWLFHYSSGELYHKGIEIARKTLIYLGNYYLAEAQKNNRVRDYHLAIQKYEEFLQKFPAVPEAAEITYYLAECYYDIKDYKKAAEVYFQVFTRFDSSEYREESAYNRILCYYQLTGMDQPEDSVTIYIDEFLDTAEILTVRVAHQSEIDFLQACNEFIISFRKSDWSVEVLMKYGEILHDLRVFIAASRVYQKILELEPDTAYTLMAAMNTGQSYYDGGNYEEAKNWFTRLVQNFPDSLEYVDKAKKLTASANFKIAEKLSKSGNSLEAAELLTSIADNTEMADLGERALFEAATQFQKAEKLQEAALTFEKLAEKHPSSELADEALYRAAGIRETKREWELAAADYLNLADHFPTSKLVKRSLKNAAICYENSEQWISAKIAYERLVGTFPEDGDDVLEALFKSGEMSLKMERIDLAKSSFDEAIRTYKKSIAQGKDVDSYFAANSQFMLGELLFEEYKGVELSPSSKTDLNRKTEKFREVFTAYKNTLEFRVADWSTAASFRIGMAFEEFVRAIVESPPPSGLSDDDLKIYTDRLAQTARPYKERALETYRQAVEQAEANEIENAWVAQSRERFQALVIELGLEENRGISGADS